MISLPKKNTFHIEKWEIDPLHNTIRNGSEQFDIEPKAMQVLEYLSRYAGQTVHRDALFKAFWPNQVVTEEALTRVISHLRHCFADLPKSPRYIVTIRKTGYRLIAKVTSGDYFSNHPIDAEPPVHQPLSIRLLNLVTKMATFSVATLLIYLIFNQPISSNISQPKSQNITNEIGEEMYPALSPNGQQVVYIKSAFIDNAPIQQLLLKDISTNKVKMLAAAPGKISHPVWSPDNIHIAYSTELLDKQAGMQYKIYRSNTATEENISLTETATHPHGLSWSSDNQYLIYPDGLHKNAQQYLYRLDIKTGKRDLILPLDGADDNTGLYSYPKYSPDGSFIAVIRTDQGTYDSIDLVDMRNNSVKSILNSEPKISSIEWKNKNTLFVITGVVADSELLELSIETGKKKYIDLEDHDIEYLSYSQEKERLIYESLDQPYNVHVSNFSIDGQLAQNFIPYTTSNRQELEAAERTDGRYTAIISSRSGSFEIWLRNNSDQQTKRLTALQARSINGLDWSPSQNKLSFVATINQVQALYWLDIESNRLSSFSHNDKSHYSLIGWQDNNTLLFSSDHEQQWKLWKYKTDKKNLELVSNKPILHGRLSPDRQSLYFVMQKESGIWVSHPDKIDITQVPGTENIIVFKSWAIAEKGIYYFMYGELGEREELYFLDFETAKTNLAAWVWNVHLNRIYWSNDKLYYTLFKNRESDIAMIEGL